jgi:hypothetical protein
VYRLLEFCIAFSILVNIEHFVNVTSYILQFLRLNESGILVIPSGLAHSRFLLKFNEHPKVLQQNWNSWNEFSSCQGEGTNYPKTSRISENTALQRWRHWRLLIRVFETNISMEHSCEQFLGISEGLKVGQALGLLFWAVLGCTLFCWGNLAYGLSE